MTAILNCILKKAEGNPSQSAIKTDEIDISYFELIDTAKKIAGYLLKQTVKGDWIGINTELGWHCYPAILACWMCGKGYLPINPQFPAKNNQKTLELANVNVIIDQKVIEACSNLDPIKTFNNCEFAYLLFTSGTTGEPKGVPIKHSNLESFANHYSNHPSIKIGASDVFLQSYALTFDVSVFCYLIAFLQGATLVLPNEKPNKQLGFFKAIQRHKVTICSFVPSVIRLTADFLPRTTFPSIRYSFFSGEALMGSWAKTWMRAVPNAKIYNCYGPTETVIVCTEELLNELHEEYFNNELPLPLGGKFEDINLEVIDGEIVFSGKQTFSGYLNNVEIQKYSSGDLAHLDENGKLIFDGRKDNQIQWNGYRIELEAIDHQLSKATNNWVKSIYLSTAKELHIFSTCDTEKVKAVYQTIFPSHYAPTNFHYLKEIPLNSNGKIAVADLKNLVLNKD